VETTQNYAMANDKQVQADFYKACEKLEGWKLLIEAAQANVPGLDANAKVDDEYDHEDEADTEKISVEVALPERFTHLPIELIRQLETYRLLKVNRWRMERVVANSKLFHSQHGIMWEFFYKICGVNTVSELRLEHVLQFVKARLDGGCSAKTVNSSLSSLRSFLAFLKEDEVYIHPSLENIQRLKEAERLPRYMTTEQVQRLKKVIEENVSNADNQGKRYDALLLRAVFYLLWQGGLRGGEVELLRFSDFYISKSNQAKRLFVRDGKWRKGRAVYLTDVALEALKAFLAIRGTEKVGGFVFVRNDMPLKKNFLFQHLKVIGKQAEVIVSPHRLRHTFATQLLNVGCKVTSIQRLLGHTNLNTTMIYARAFDQTVMLDYVDAINTIETQPGGAWHEIDLPLD